MGDCLGYVLLHNKRFFLMFHSDRLGWVILEVVCPKGIYGLVFRLVLGSLELGGEGSHSV